MPGDEDDTLVGHYITCGGYASGGMKKETGTDRDERTRGRMKRGCYMCVCYAPHAHVHVQRSSFTVSIGFTQARGEKESRGREGTEGSASGKKQSLKGGGQGARDVRERERRRERRRRVHGEEERCPGPTGTTVRGGERRVRGEE